MKLLQLENERFVTFRNIGDVQGDCVEVPDGFLEPTDKRSTFDRVNVAWVPYVEPEPDLDAVKLAKCYELKHAQEAEEISDTSKTTSIAVSADINARRKDLDNVRSMLKVIGDFGGILPFRLYDNSTAYVTELQLAGIEKELIVHGMQLYQKKWDLQAATMACTSVEDVRKISWNEPGVII